MNSITRTVKGVHRRSEIEYWENKGFVLINEHTTAYVDGGDTEVTLVFEEVKPKEGRC